MKKTFVTICLVAVYMFAMVSCGSSTERAQEAYDNAVEDVTEATSAAMDAYNNAF